MQKQKEIIGHLLDDQLMEVLNQGWPQKIDDQLNQNVVKSMKNNH